MRKLLRLIGSLCLAFAIGNKECKRIDSLEGWPTEIRTWEYSVLYWAGQYQMDPNLIAAVIKVESDGSPFAQSKAGAIGLMQIMPQYHSCADWQPHANIGCGVYILATYYHRAGDDWRQALAAYYAGERGRDRYGRGYDYADLVLRTMKSKGGG